ncbi:MAG: HlyC/CorC family transporter, partial [Nitrospinae bacterium]|nr:HlyC/CorC family transporter [Nitrospinota bacterium]
LVFSEITPKTLAIRHAESYAIMTVSYLDFFHKRVFFLQNFLRKTAQNILALFGVFEVISDQSITEEEIKTIVDVSEDEGNLKENEKEMITNVFELNDITVEEISCHRADMVALSESDTVAEVLLALKEKKYSRIPVYKESLDNITGIILVKDILRVKGEEEDWEHVPLNEIMVKPYIVPESKKVGDLLKDFQQKRIHIAIVADEFGVTNGLITLDDILSAITGKKNVNEEEIVDGLKVIDERTIHINASLPIEEFNKFFDKKVPLEEFDTVGGFVFHLFGYLPEWGEKVIFENLTFYVIEKKGFRLMKLKVVSEA